MTESEFQARVMRRLEAVEQRLGVVETKNAVDEVHRQNVEKRLSGIEDTLKRLVWIVLTAILIACMTWILGGGLAGA